MLLAIVAVPLLVCGWWWSVPLEPIPETTQVEASRQSASGPLAIPTPTKKTEPAPLSASPIRNTTAAASYVGAESCAACHADQQRSYLHTAHSLAMSDIDLATEPEDGSFFHAASGRHYSVYRRDGQLRHREAARNESGKDYAVSDYPIRYLIGSGRHTRSYLVEVDGFLVESPITFYASRKAWGMSPGYDRANHRGFERAADATCLVCHIGQMSAPDTEYQRFTFSEKAIGCERCHGPGSLHVAEARAIRGGAARADVAAASIVNPTRLSRELNEAICAQCHLMGDAAVTVRGRGIADFRPGLPLADFTANYRLDEPDAQMKVVGHVDQMRQSRCYQASANLTCTSCHDQHAGKSSAAEQQHYIETCIGCHGAEGCRLDRAQRLAKSATNDCVACHMPRTNTEIPHIAFTHHRIAVHAPETLAAPSPRAPGLPALALQSMYDESGLNERDRRHNLGLAYLGLSLHESDPLAAAEHRNRAAKLLGDLGAEGYSNGETLGALARIAYANSDLANSARLAIESLDYCDLTPKTRVNNLFFLSEIAIRAKQPALARPALEQLIATRWLAEDWNLFGMLHLQEQDNAAAQHALEHAIGIAPFRPDLRQRLARIYALQGSNEFAERELQIARQLGGEAASAEPKP